MTTDFRAELQALLTAIEDDVIDTNDGPRFQRAVDRARAALPESDGPAVPDGREPASIVSEPSDDELLSLDQLRDAWNAQADAMNSWDDLGIDEIIWWAQLQALAHWLPAHALPQPS